MLKMSQRAAQARPRRAGYEPKSTYREKGDQRISDLEWQMNFAKITLRCRKYVADDSLKALRDLHDNAAIQLKSLKNC